MFRLIATRTLPKFDIFHSTRFFSALQQTHRPKMENKLEFVDIGVNLTDGMYKGKYHGKKVHQPDLENVLERAQKAGVVAQMVTAGSLSEVKEVLELIKPNDHHSFPLYATAGIHPTRTSGVDQELKYIETLRSYLEKESISRNPEKGKIIAIGECGLDYDRLQFSSKEIQLQHFPHQLELAKEFRLPLFLHCRSAQNDFIDILRKQSDAIATACETEQTKHDLHKRKRIGVAHCFTGSVEEMEELIKEGLFIGLTGCSFKEQEGIKVAEKVPLEYLLLETDAPWCDLRQTHASAPLLKSFSTKHADLFALYSPPSVKKEKWEANKQVKSRNEPCAIGTVAAVIAEAKGIEFSIVVKAARENTKFLFNI